MLGHSQYTSLSPMDGHFMLGRPFKTNNGLQVRRSHMDSKSDEKASRIMLILC
jgi:hypothetical protein